MSRFDACATAIIRHLNHLDGLGWLYPAHAGRFNCSHPAAIYTGVHCILYYSSRVVLPIRYSERVSEFFCWAHSTPYFKKQEQILEDDTPKSKVMMAQHPHGILCMGWIVHIALHAKWQASRFHLLIADTLINLPIASNVFGWIGCESASKQNFEKRLNEGDNIFEYGKHRIFAKKRAGFINHGLQYGYKIYIPHSHLVSSIPTLAQSLPTPWRVPFGSWWCFYMPLHSAEIVTVVGKPIQLPTITNPTREDVKKYHKVYLDAVQDLFERNKTKHASNPKAGLEVF
ncbi:hypothetical protein AC1031_006684 [Aphanomyces cochlioides]|nr:hypothetical protein AC1031_006684 [Aphanomyces cochlioides]